LTRLTGCIVLRLTDDGNCQIVTIRSPAIVGSGGTLGLAELIRREHFAFELGREPAQCDGGRAPGSRLDRLSDGVVASPSCSAEPSFARHSSAREIIPLLCVVASLATRVVG
jgi:hypothetical protein